MLGDELDSHARFLEVMIEGLRLVNIYLPNGNPIGTEKFAYKLAWMDRLALQMQAWLASGVPTIVGGDFNVIPEDMDCHKPASWIHDALFQPEPRARYRAMLSLGYVDAFRSLHPGEGGQYTFWDYFRRAFEYNRGIRMLSRIKGTFVQLRSGGEKARRALYLTLVASLVITIASAAVGQSFASSSAADIPGGLLPPEFVVSLRLVGQFFPEIVQTASTGRNGTAVGNPEATRAVIYANSDGTKLVTVTVDRYATVEDAAAAYREARDKSEAVKGFGPISLRLHVGRKSFAGTVTMNGETHLGLGALDGRLIIGATLAGFDATPGALINLVALARAEDAAANAAAGH